jgi:hypothetical protein
LPKKERIITARLEHPVWGPISSFDPLWGPNLIEGINGESTRNLKRAGIEFTEPQGLSDLVVQRGHAAGSPVWYAARIVEQIASARGAFTNNQSRGEIVHSLLHLGMLLMEASFVVLHGPKFKTGVKQYQWLAKIRSNWNARQRAQARDRHSIWISKAKEIWGKNSKLTVSRCAGLVITKLADKPAPKTVEDVIRPFAPKKVKVSDAG